MMLGFEHSKGELYGLCCLLGDAPSVSAFGYLEQLVFPGKVLAIHRQASPEGTSYIKAESVTEEACPSHSRRS
jgi:hypothetical protein